MHYTSSRDGMDPLSFEYDAKHTFDDICHFSAPSHEQMQKMTVAQAEAILVEARALLHTFYTSTRSLFISVELSVQMAKKDCSELHVDSFAQDEAFSASMVAAVRAAAAASSQSM